MKPPSIRRFDLLYLASIALSIVAYVLSYDSLVTNVEARTAAAGMQLGVATVIATIVVSLAVSLLLWFLVSQRRIAFVRWIIALLFVLGLFGLPDLLASGWGVLKVLSLFNLLLQAAAVFYLFQPDAKAWLLGHDAVPADVGPETPLD